MTYMKGFFLLRNWPCPRPQPRALWVFRLQPKSSKIGQTPWRTVVSPTQQKQVSDMPVTCKTKYSACNNLQMCDVWHVHKNIMKSGSLCGCKEKWKNKAGLGLLSIGQSLLETSEELPRKFLCLFWIPSHFCSFSCFLALILHPWNEHNDCRFHCISARSSWAPMIRCSCCSGFPSHLSIFLTVSVFAVVCFCGLLIPVCGYGLTMPFGQWQYEVKYLDGWMFDSSDIFKRVLDVCMSESV